MTSTSPIQWSWDDPDADPCPQCADISEFVAETLPGLHYKLHKEATAAANSRATRLADRDQLTGCSLSWEDLFLHHFTVLYRRILAGLKDRTLTEYQDLCYRKSYDTDSFCPYHAECRGDAVRITVR